MLSDASTAVDFLLLTQWYLNLHNTINIVLQMFNCNPISQTTNLQQTTLTISWKKIGEISLKERIIFHRVENTVI